MSSFLVLSRRHVKSHLLRHFSTTAAATTATKPKTPKPTPSSAVTLLRREFDPDRALKILSSSSSSSSSSRYAVFLAARRLSRSRRSADATSLLLSNLQNTSPLTESHLSFVLSSFSFASLSPHSALSAFLSHAPQIPDGPTGQSFNAVLTSFLRHRELHRRVPDLFSQLSQDFNIRPNVTSYCILVKAHCLSGNVPKAFEVLSEMREKGVEPTVAIYTSIVDSLYKQGKVEEAEKAWEEMMASGCTLDSPVYNVRVFHFAKKGKVEEVLGIMKEMKEKGVKNDTVTWNFLMMGYFKSGMVQEAVEVYKGLVSGEKGSKANAATYKNALAKLCEAGEFGRGLRVFRDSLRRNKVPDFMTVKGLVEGLVREGEVEKAKQVVDEVMKKFPDKQLSGWRRVEKELGLSKDGTEMAASVDAAEVEDVKEKVAMSMDGSQVSAQEDAEEEWGAEDDAVLSLVRGEVSQADVAEEEDVEEEIVLSSNGEEVSQQSAAEAEYLQEVIAVSTDAEEASQADAAEAENVEEDVVLNMDGVEVSLQVEADEAQEIEEEGVVSLDSEEGSPQEEAAQVRGESVH